MMLFDQKADSVEHCADERSAVGTKDCVSSLRRTMTLANRSSEATMDAPPKMSELAFRAAIQIDMILRHEALEAPAVIQLAECLHVPPASDLQQRSFAGVSALGDATRAWFSLDERQAAYKSWAEFVTSFGDFVNRLRYVSADTNEQALIEAKKFCQALSRQALAFERGVEGERNHSIFDRAFCR